MRERSAGLGLPIPSAPEGPLGVVLDVHAAPGDDVLGPESTAATWVAELAVSVRDVRRARAPAETVLRDAVRVDAAATRP